MKFRTDFVTNSSSSSFIVAKKGEFSEEQLDIMLAKIKSHILGKQIATDKKELDIYFNERYSIDFSDFSIEKRNEEPYCNHYITNKYIECLQLIEKGFVVYEGYVSFEDEWQYPNLLREIWKELSNSSENNFKEIDTDLYY